MSIGADYVVLEILADGRRTEFRVLNPAESFDSLGIWDAGMFVLISERIPSCWVAGLSDGCLTLAPPEWQESGFWENYFDGVPAAVATFDRLKVEISAAA